MYGIAIFSLGVIFARSKRYLSYSTYGINAKMRGYITLHKHNIAADTHEVPERKEDRECKNALCPLFGM